MPRGDRTGPMGMGATSGRAAGWCAGYDAPGYANPGSRRGLAFRRRFGRGYNPGFGRGRRFQGAYPPAWDVPAGMPIAPAVSREQETSWLKAQASDLQAALRRTNERLEELEKR